MRQKTCIAPRFRRRSMITRKRLLLLLFLLLPPRLFRRPLLRENGNPHQTPSVPCLPIPFTRMATPMAEYKKKLVLTVHALLLLSNPGFFSFQKDCRELYKSDLLILYYVRTHPLHGLLLRALGPSGTHTAHLRVLLRLLRARSTLQLLCFSYPPPTVLPTNTCCGLRYTLFCPCANELSTRRYLYLFFVPFCSLAWLANTVVGGYYYLCWRALACTLYSTLGDATQWCT